jgi:uncharacterized phage protein gp47/JayE
VADTGFVRPTLRSIVSRIAQDMNVRLPGLDAHLRRSKAQVIARALGGAAHTVYGYAASIAREILVSTASAAGLVKHGEIWGVPRKQARAATCLWHFIGTPGTEVPEGTAIVQQDGLQWLTLALGTVGGGSSVDILCEAQTAGAIGNVAELTKATLVSPIAGINSAVTAAEDATDGADVEDAGAWRARILARIRNPPQGGAATDYEQWALQVEGVERVWVTPNGLGPGTVVVRFAVAGTGEDAIPDGAKVTEVQDHIEPLAPVTAEVTVVAPVAYPVAFEIAVSPDTAEVRAAVEAELEALFAEQADPEGGIIRNSVLREAISRADGEEYHTLTTPVGDVQAPVGELPILGTITWS